MNFEIAKTTNSTRIVPIPNERWDVERERGARDRDREAERQKYKAMNGPVRHIKYVFRHCVTHVVNLFGSPSLLLLYIFVAQWIIFLKPSNFNFFGNYFKSIFEHVHIRHTFDAVSTLLTKLVTNHAPSHQHTHTHSHIHNLAYILHTIEVELKRKQLAVNSTQF